MRTSKRRRGKDQPLPHLDIHERQRVGDTCLRMDCQLFRSHVRITLDQRFDETHQGPRRADASGGWKWDINIQTDITMPQTTFGCAVREKGAPNTMTGTHSDAGQPSGQHVDKSVINWMVMILRLSYLDGLNRLSTRLWRERWGTICATNS